MSILVTRRRLLGLSASALLAGGWWPGQLAAEPGGVGSFRFLAVNDLHYFNKQCGPWFEKVVRSMNAQTGVDFVLISGDLVELGTTEQFAAIRELLQTLRVPFHVVVGNHDYRTQTDRQAFESEFPKQLNYTFDHQGWQFIGLDTTEGQKSQNVKAPRETSTWLDATLPKLDPKKPTVIFTHFPLAFGVPFLLINAASLLERFKSFNLQAVYSGHYHGFTEKKNGPVVLTTDKCCSFHRANHDRTPEKGYFLCSVQEGRIERRFIEVK
jgi:3',5'-cyclic AMP phosphodiesterase CpdA